MEGQKVVPEGVGADRPAGASYTGTVPGLPGVTIERDVPCAMRDGVRLFADIYRPVDRAPHPVILMRSPYDKSGGQSNFGYTHPSWYARHGYIVVQQDSRGRWSSEGEFYPFRYEAADGYDTVEWAATLPGSTGQVAMYGYSYPGMLQLQVAALAPPHLAAVCPGFCGHDFRDGCLYDGGAFRLALAATWSAFLSTDTARRAGDVHGLDAAWASRRNAACGYWSTPLSDYRGVDPRYAPYFFDWIQHPTADDYWKEFAVDLRGVNVPAMHIGGLYDAFVRGNVDTFNLIRRVASADETRRRQKLLIGPWIHDPWVPTNGRDGSAGSMAIDDWQLRWFDSVLKGRESRVLEAPVTVYVLGAGWRDFDDWPPTSAGEVSFYLHSDGRANSSYGDGVLSQSAPTVEPPDIFYYDPATPTMSNGGHSCCAREVAPMGPADQSGSESEPIVLVYTSQPFTRDVDMVGEASVRLHAASSATDTDFVARLCIVDVSGISRNIQEGIIRASYRESSTTPRPITPGRVYQYDIRLGPVAVVVHAGERIRLDIASSDFPQWDRNLNAGGHNHATNLLESVPATQVILHDRDHPSCLVLPLMGTDRSPD